jgi:hypothetical protein
MKPGRILVRPLIYNVSGVTKFAQTRKIAVFPSEILSYAGTSRGGAAGLPKPAKGLRH